MNPQSALRLSGISKTYPGVRALSNVNFVLDVGTVHALVGENGAGKSTLMKVAAGAVHPEEGAVEINGRRVQPGDPRASAAAGLAMIYQELTTIGELDALGNVLLGQLPHRWGSVDRRRARRRYTEIANQVGVSIPPAAKARELSTAQRQELEIMRAVASDRGVVVMDEPTASLGPRDRDRLRDVIRRLAAAGSGVVYISHDLDEVLTIADQITVMREGRVISAGAVSRWTKASLITAMLGRSLTPAPPRRNRIAQRTTLHISGLRAAGIEIDDLQVERGEILGIAGLVGSGRTELLRALAGADPIRSGRLRIDGRAVKWPTHPRAALGLGIALAPEDRKAQGLVLNQSAALNASLADLSAASRFGLLSGGRICESAAAPLSVVGFDKRRSGAAAGTFSGGNQQKVVLARWLHRAPRVLLLDEPTRGIDLGAKAEIFNAMQRLADDGLTIVFVSSELEEVVQHSHRVVVLAQGRLVADLGASATVDVILRHSFGQPTGSGHEAHLPPANSPHPEGIRL
jgi:ABC-type sugar transport system ATPase subunit